MFRNPQEHTVYFNGNAYHVSRWDNVSVISWQGQFGNTPGYVITGYNPTKR